MPEDGALSNAQRYLNENADVLANAEERAEGMDFVDGGRQLFLDSVAREHYDSFGMNEGRENFEMRAFNPANRSNFTQEVSSLSPERQYINANPDVAMAADKEFRDRGFTSYDTIPDYQDTYARRHYHGTPFTESYGINEGRDGFGMQIPDVNPQLMNIAKITSNVVDSPGVGQNEDMILPTYRFNSDIPNPGALSDTFYDIGKSFQIGALDGYGSNMNTDMAGRDMSKFLQKAYGGRGFGYQDTLVDSLGGFGELLRAYDILGVTGEGDSYADKQVAGFLDYINQPGNSSIDKDGTGGESAIAKDNSVNLSNFSSDTALGKTLGAFKGLPPSGPWGLAYKAGDVLYNVMVNDESVTDALGNAFGYGVGQSYTNPEPGFGSYSNETGMGEGYKEGGSTSLKDSLQINKPRATPSHPKKSHVVKINDNGQERMLRFGQQGAKTNKNAKQRQAFKDRHAKNIARGKTSPAYWANKVKWKAAEGGLAEYDPAKIAALKESMMNG